MGADMRSATLHDLFLDAACARARRRVEAEVDLKLTDLIHRMDAGFYRIYRSLDLWPPGWGESPLTAAASRLDPVRAHFDLQRLGKE